MDGDNVGVGESRHRPCFLFETDLEFRGQCPLGRQYLQGNKPVQVGLTGLVHNAHSPLPGKPKNLQPMEWFSGLNRGRHGFRNQVHGLCLTLDALFIVPDEFGSTVHAGTDRTHDLVSRALAIPPFSIIPQTHRSGGMERILAAPQLF